jgi:membrane fusion protein (multidrug efflux system)
MPYGESDRDDAAAAEAPARADAPTREHPPTEPDKREHDAGETRGKEDGHQLSDTSADTDDRTGKGDDSPKRRSPLIWIIVGIVALIAIAGGSAYWFMTRNLESTDDAYTDGRAIIIAPKVSGYVVELAVTDNQFVHAGDVILKIDPRDFIAARDQAKGTLAAARGQYQASQAALAVARKNFPARLQSAQAQLLSAQAQLANAEAEDRRQHAVSRAATTQTAVDQADANLRQAQASVAEAQANVRQAEPVQENINQSQAQVEQVQGSILQAQAQLEQAELNLGYTLLRAPQDGWVTKRNVEQGNYVNAGAQVMSLVSPDIWVTANFKETQLNRMRPGQRVDVGVDAYPFLKLKGHVDSVQLGSGSRFSAFPAENATGNFVKIVQRVPVKIDIDSGLDPALPLPLGLSVEPTVHLK